MAPLRIELRSHRHQLGEPLPVHEAPLVVDDQETSIVVDAVAPQLDALTHLYRETLDRSDVKPSDAHRSSVPHTSPR